METTSEVTSKCMEEPESTSPVELLSEPQANTSFIKFAGPVIGSMIREHSQAESHE